MVIAVSRRLGPLLSSALLLAGCDMSIGHLTGRATDEWTHRYPLSPNGEVRIVNTNGKIEVEGTDAATLDMSVLGRDITSSFAVIVDRPGKVVCLVGQRHRYVVLAD